MSPRFLGLLAVLLFAGSGQAQALPLVDEDDWPTLRAHCRELVKHLASLDAPLPADTVKALDKLVNQKKPEDAPAACRAVQKLLDAHCLIGVNINPESRVKAARGPLRAALVRDRTAHVLIKVHNDAGVTHPLSADSPQRRTPGKKEQDAERWLELAVRNDKPFADRLSGARVEYRVLTLTPRQSGKREATVAFDVGQGTQDLGFRAEVPILFSITAPKK